jgi:uncharacterized protein YbjQ (UPF0145 family)
MPTYYIRENPEADIKGTYSLEELQVMFAGGGVSANCRAIEASGQSHRQLTRIPSEEWTLVADLFASAALPPLPAPIPVVTTQTLPGVSITRSHGIVTGEVIMGANFLRDFAAGVRDIVGGRSGAYESKLREGRRLAMDELVAEARRCGADAVVAVSIGYEVVGPNGSMLMICATGTAVSVEANQPNKVPDDDLAHL